MDKWVDGWADGFRWALDGQMGGRGWGSRTEGRPGVAGLVDEQVEEAGAKVTALRSRGSHLLAEPGQWPVPW